MYYKITKACELAIFCKFGIFFKLAVTNVKIKAIASFMA